MPRRAQRANEPELKRSDVICKVQCTLDYLKLCADHKNPTGEGIPVDITIMPDFVVDVDGAAIHLFNKCSEAGGRISAAEVGSRAGRVLSILAQLRDRDDEGYCLNYIAKTSPAGRAVLEERLQRHLARRGIEPVRFPYLVPADYTRFATLGRTYYRAIAGRNRRLVWPSAASILTTSELHRHFYKPLRAVRDANALYFATDSMSQFEELISSVVSGAEPEPDAGGALGNGFLEKHKGFRFVIIDLAAIHHIEGPTYEGEDISGIPGLALLKLAVDELIEKSRNGDSVASRTRLIVIVKEPKQMSSNPKRYVDSLYHHAINLRDLKDAVVVYRQSDDVRIHGEAPDRHGILWFDGIHHDEVSVDIDRNRPDVREAFVAGIVLHRAVASAWSTIPRKGRLHYAMHQGDDWTRGLIPDPYGHGAPSGYWQDLDEEWKFLKHHWPFSEAVQMGAAMAGSWDQKPTGEMPDRRALLVANIDEKDETAEGDLAIDLSLLVDRDPVGWYKKVTSIEAKYLAQDTVLDKDTPFIEHLWQAARELDLLEHPNEWKGNVAKALRIGFWGTLRTAIALRVLRSLSRRSKGGLKCFAKNAAYLTDLDGTLLQSSGLRALCLKNAFLPIVAHRWQIEQINESFPALPGDAGDRDSLMEILDTCNELYHAAVYKQARYWTVILDKYPYYAYGSCPKDFRQVWNHRLSYPVFLWILKRWVFGDDDVSPPDLPREIVLAALHSEKGMELLDMASDGRVARCTVDLTQWFGIEEQPDGTLVISEGEVKIEKFFKQIASIETKYRRYFEEAAVRYWNVHYQPIRHTRECLSAMRDVLGTQLYVATEGYHETQLKKIEVLGLERFFSDMRVMSTEAAASTTDEDLRSIRHELQKANGTRSGVDQLDNAVKKLPDSKHVADQIGTIMVNISRDLQKQINYLTLYENQWRIFEKKEAQYIYPLIVASVMADHESPFAAMTDLGNLVDRIEDKAETITKTYFAMVGDREKNDIRPIINSCGKTPVRDGEPQIDRVTTVRLLTLDHKNENPYWPTRGDADPKDQDPPVAHHVAWTPIQAMLCLAREEAWSVPLDYHTIPAIIPGRLMDVHRDDLNEDMFQALVWGRGQEKWALQRSARLVGFLVLRSTIRDEEIDNLKFVKAAAKRLGLYRKNKDWDAYEFAIAVMNHIAFETAYMPALKSGEVPEKIKDAMCVECRAKLEEVDSRRRAVCMEKIKRVFQNLANLDGRPQCSPPDQNCRKWILECELDKDEEIRLRKLMNDWEAQWAKHGQPNP